MDHHPLLMIAIGILCGVFSATFGVGSGILITPILVLGFALGQKSAQGISLCVMVPMALVGALRYIHHPDIEVDLRLAAWLAVGGVVGAFAGIWVVAALPVATLKRLFAVLMMVAAVRMLWPDRSHAAGPPPPANPDPAPESDAYQIQKP